MNAPRSDLAFPDCRMFLDKAVNDDKGWRMIFREKGEATNFRLRCYTARRRQLKLNAQVYLGEDDASTLARRTTHWDGLVILIREVDTGWAVLALHDAQALMGVQAIEQGPIL